jgi:hypothetical protein
MVMMMMMMTIIILTIIIMRVMGVVGAAMVVVVVERLERVVVVRRRNGVLLLQLVSCRKGHSHHGFKLDMESGLGHQCARRERILLLDLNLDLELDRGEHQNLRLGEGTLNGNAVHLMGPPTFSSSLLVAI